MTIDYGLYVGPYPRLRDAEHKCRYTLARKRAFPNHAPDSINGGCVERDERSEVHLSCPECSAARKAWLDSGIGTPTEDEWFLEFIATEPAPMKDVVAALHRRIDELDERGEIELVNCLGGYLTHYEDFARRLDRVEQ